MTKDEIVLTEDQRKKLLQQVEVSSERHVSVREAAEMLQKGDITTEQYIDSIANSIGKEKFWEIYNECLADYFRGFSFDDKTVLSKLKEYDDENAIQNKPHV